MQLATAQRFDHFLVDVHPNYLEAVSGKGAGSGQSDITQTEYTDFSKDHNILLNRKPKRDSAEKFRD
jgi:hypothetical protein